MITNEKLINRLVLGTAQLGMPYGIANKKAQPNDSQVFDIVKVAWERGIREFDTAQAYGRSERALGKALTRLGVSEQARIITKIAPKIDLSNVDDVRRSVAKSLEYLKVSCLYGLLFHREEVLDLSTRKIKLLVQNLKADGMAMHIGVSVYTPAKAIQALESGLFNILQIPANILDRRFYNAGIFYLAKNLDTQIYVRSIFLQGFLLLDPDDLPSTMAFARDVLASLVLLSKEIGMSCREIAILYVKSRYADAKILFGAETVHQVQENADTWSTNLTNSAMDWLEEEFAHVDEIILNPALWPK